MNAAARFFQAWAEARPPLVQIHRDLRHPGREYAYCDTRCAALILLDWKGELRLGEDTHRVEGPCAALIPDGMHRLFRPRDTGWHRVVNFPPRAKLAPSVIPLGAEFPLLSRTYDECLGHFGSQPARAESMAWELLWQFADALDRLDHAQAVTILVREALRRIELKLSQRFTVAALAAELGVSAAHLSRSFQRDLGMPVVAHLRKRRMELAKHLLTRATVPVREVAAACGMPDAQWFNKAVRRAFGHSPSALRNSDSGSNHTHHIRN